jgi:soluble lytic murein transglycosylase
MAAEQFEALFLQQVLKQMRKASDALSTDSPIRSRELDTMRDFYDGVLAENLAGKKQTGIADMLVKQLSGEAGAGMDTEQAGAAARSANLPQRTASLIEPLRGTWQRGIDNLKKGWQHGSENFMALVDSVIRHESGGRVDAVSPKGALGVMQLMPDTARDMAAELGVGFSEARLSRDPSYNKQLGSAYLGKMLNRYDGEPALAVAAYNAGPGKVDEWLQRNGDPRRGDVSVTSWVARIPFAETRDYATSILRDLQQTPVPMRAKSASADPVNSNSSTLPFKSTADVVALNDRATPISANSAHQSNSAAFAQRIRIERLETE